MGATTTIWWGGSHRHTQDCTGPAACGAAQRDGVSAIRPDPLPAACVWRGRPSTVVESLVSCRAPEQPFADQSQTQTMHVCQTCFLRSENTRHAVGVGRCVEVLYLRGARGHTYHSAGHAHTHISD
eukprot:6244138-Prymnesium_polylepis.1